MSEVDQYISKFSGETNKRMRQIRKTILSVSKDITEGIGYGMPAYKLSGKPLVYFAGYAHHIGFYATPTGHLEFARELSQYKQGKGSVQFPLDQPLPIDLIRRIVVFRLVEVGEQVAKTNQRTCPAGHVFVKSSNCPTCPECERLKKSESGFLSELVAPARRALQNAGIDSAKKLARLSEKEVLSLHGIGKTSLPVIHSMLKREGLKLRAD